jgi:hypothetical protein
VTRNGIVVEVVATAVAPLHDEELMDTAAERMAMRLMSRSALLAYRAARQTMHTAQWKGGDDIGVFMGVGASGADLVQLQRMLVASQHNGVFDIATFGDQGLKACNPLFAFSLMNNFTLAHSAALCDLRGPNAALFSRGAGTVAALEEAMASLAEGACNRALVGGADTLLHPVTDIETQRLMEQLPTHDLPCVPNGEGAAFLALEKRSSPSSANAWQVTSIEIANRPSAAQIDTFLHRLLGCAHLWIWSPWPAQTEDLQKRLAGLVHNVHIGDNAHCLAANPALAWCQALSAAEQSKQVTVLTVDVDGSYAAVQFARGNQ